jgi:hypothetical protein
MPRKKKKKSPADVFKESVEHEERQRSVPREVLEAVPPALNKLAKICGDQVEMALVMIRAGAGDREAVVLTNQNGQVNVRRMCKLVVGLMLEGEDHALQADVRQETLSTCMKAIQAAFGEYETNVSVIISGKHTDKVIVASTETSRQKFLQAAYEAIKLTVASINQEDKGVGGKWAYQ